MAVRIGLGLSSQKYLVCQSLKKTFNSNNINNFRHCSTSASTSKTKNEGSSYSTEKTTHFGFKTVTEEEKKNKGYTDCHKLLFYSIPIKVINFSTNLQSLPMDPIDAQ